MCIIQPTYEPMRKKVNRYFIAVINIHDDNFDLLEERIKDLLQEMRVHFIINYSNQDPVLIQEVTELVFKDELSQFN
jgi:hypothetical protein